VRYVFYSCENNDKAFFFLGVRNRQFEQNCGQRLPNTVSAPFFRQPPLNHHHHPSFFPVECLQSDFPNHPLLLDPARARIEDETKILAFRKDEYTALGGLSHLVG
jgi:hypothetical protein